LDDAKHDILANSKSVITVFLIAELQSIFILIKHVNISMEHCLQATTYTFGYNAKLGGYKNITFRPYVKKLAELCKVKFL